MIFHISTLGCKVNQFESQAMEALLTERGHTVTEAETGCGAVILNTCAVTAEAVRKSRQALRRLRALNPDAVIGVCGCWPQAEPDAAPEADVVFGSGDHQAFLDALERKAQTRDVDNALQRREFERLPSGSGSRTRALLKIEDGCVNFCAYCIIPYTRGPVRSLPLPEVGQEAARLCREGFREIVLTGIEIASYGRDLPDSVTLADAVEAVSENAPSVRIRLGSLEPRVVTEPFCRRLAALPNLCPHFHLSLQSGSDATLSRMRRKYDTARFYESVTLLRTFFRGCGLTADLITGFPGETEAEFSETLAFLERCAFSRVHVFPYSVRPGTAAASMEGQLPQQVRHERARRAAETASGTAEAFLQAQLGGTQEVLFETEPVPGVWEGHTGNYLTVQALGKDLRNRLANVRITGVQDGILSGEILL